MSVLYILNAIRVLDAIEEKDGQFIKSLIDPW